MGAQNYPFIISWPFWVALIYLSMTIHSFAKAPHLQFYLLLEFIFLDILNVPEEVEVRNC